MPKKLRSSKPHPALTPNRGKLYRQMLHWQQEFPAIMAILRAHVDGLPIPANFSWIENYQGNLWKTARELDVGHIPLSLNQSLALLWGSPKDLEKKFENTLEEELLALLKDGEVDAEATTQEFIDGIFALWGKLLAFTKNLECVAIHGKSLNELILRGRTEDASLLDAVRIDPALVSHPWFKARISRAAFTDEKPFFADLCAALKPQNLKSRNINTNLSPLRLIIAMMGESGDLEIKPEKVRLFIQEEVGLDYYSGHDPESFRKEFLRLKNDYIGTSKPA